MPVGGHKLVARRDPCIAGYRHALLVYPFLTALSARSLFSVGPQHGVFLVNRLVSLAANLPSICMRLFIVALFGYGLGGAGDGPEVVITLYGE